MEEAKPEIRTNVIVMIKDADEIKKRLENGTVSNPMGTFQVIYASSITDANTPRILDHRLNLKLRTLIIDEHEKNT